MFDEKDLKHHKGLMMLLDDATFSLKAKEVGSFMAIYNWASTLPEKMKQAPVDKPEEPTPGSIKKKTTRKKNGAG